MNKMKKDKLLVFVVVLVVVALVGVVVYFGALQSVVQFSKPKVVFVASHVVRSVSNSDLGVIVPGNNTASVLLGVSRSGDEQDFVFTSFYVVLNDSDEGVPVFGAYIENKNGYDGGLWSVNVKTGGYCMASQGVSRSDCCQLAGYEKNVVNWAAMDAAAHNYYIDYKACYSKPVVHANIVKVEVAGVVVPLTKSGSTWSSGNIAGLMNNFCVFGFNFMNGSCSIPVTIVNAAGDGSGVYVNSIYVFEKAKPNVVYVENIVNNTVYVNQTVVDLQEKVVYVNQTEYVLRNNTVYVPVESPNIEVASSSVTNGILAKYGFYLLGGIVVVLILVVLIVMNAPRKGKRRKRR